MPEYESINPGAQHQDSLKKTAKQCWPLLIGVLLLLLQGCATTPALSPSEATQNQAKAAYLVGDYQRTLAIIMPLADAGEPWAQYTLGYMYYYGHGVRQDRQTAKQWIQSAAAKGYPPALQAMQRLSAPLPTTEEENNEPTKPAPFDTEGKAAPPTQPESNGQTPVETTPQITPVTPPPSVEQPAPPAPQPAQPTTPPAQETAPAPPAVEPSDTPPSTTAPPQSSSQEETNNATKEPSRVAEPPPSPAASMPPQTTASPSSAQADKATDHAPPAPTLDQGIRDRDWISNQDPRQFTVQLISGENEAAVVRFIRKHHIEKQAAYYSTMRSGKTWYSVVYGNFPNHNAARQALSRLPRVLRRDSPRIRNFQGIQAQLRPTP